MKLFNELQGGNGANPCSTNVLFHGHRMTMEKRCSIATALMLVPLLCLGAAPIPSGAAVGIVVTNILSAQGLVHVELCSESAFLTNNCRYYATAPAAIGAVTVLIPSVPEGRYAAQSFQDLNNNGKIDRNFLGIPREPFGFSNDAPIRMAPPRFADAAFVHGDTLQRISFRLRHIL